MLGETANAGCEFRNALREYTRDALDWLGKTPAKNLRLGSSWLALLDGGQRMAAGAGSLAHPVNEVIRQEAKRESAHDDLVIALALSVWFRNRYEEPRFADAGGRLREK